MRPALGWIVAVTVLTAFSAEEVDVMLTISSPAFEDGGEIPRRFTCQGDDVSPPLGFAGVSEGTLSLVLIVDDPDAPDPAAPRMTWVHWVLFNMPSDTSNLPAAIASDAFPGSTGEGLNDWGRTGYGGPCPPIGRHRYFHKLYALDTTLSFVSEPTKEQLLAAMEGHVLTSAELIGTYEKD